ncbi:MAG: hypothetical protein LUC93_04690, partial [Planctomycetaceae bacterium]|nr:hypothetical protein [Planctomycetaceae bacterium]
RRVQDMNRHHAYIILLAKTLFLSVLALFVINFIATRRHVAIKTLSAAMAVAFFVAFLGNIPLAFDSRYAELAEKTQPITTTLRRYPTVLSSYDAIQDITANFKERIQDSPERVYVATVSPLFNADYILRSEMPKRISAVDFLLKTNNVDLRDGFPSQAFTANYIALEYPFYQEFGNRQEVVYQLFDMVVNSRIGEEYYQLEQNYPIGDGKEVRLYRRTKNATIRLVDELKERLKTYYPETPLVFSPSYFIALAQILAPGNFSLHTNPGDNQIYFYKAANAEAAVRINDTSDFSRLAFQVRMVESHCDMVVRNQDGELFQQTVSAEGMIDVEVDIAGSEYLDLVFTDTDSNQPIGVFIMIFQPELR